MDSRDFADAAPPSARPSSRPEPFRPALESIASNASDGTTLNDSPRRDERLRVEGSTEEPNTTQTFPTRSPYPPDTSSRYPQSPPSYPSLRNRSFTTRESDPSATGQPALRRVRTDGSEKRRNSGASATGASFKGRIKRSDTIKTYRKPTGPNWQPGAEPGIDTTDGAADDDLHPYELSDITVVDFSDTPQHYQEYQLSNDVDDNTFADFITHDRPAWASCRLICVNGLSWDVIKLIGNRYKLHRLAIEDLMITRSRTKADWYSDHCFMVLTLQKLVRLHYDDNEGYASDDDDDEDTPYEVFKARGLKRPGFWRRMFPKRSTPRHQPKPLDDEKAPDRLKTVSAHASTSADAPVKSITTLQRYHGANRDCIEYMEDHSALADECLAVSVEQVSIFLTSNNEVICFFEHSAPDVLGPITDRLRSEETILRRSADGSVLTQSLLDAIIDLAMPVAAAYDDSIGSLEFDVMMDPDMSQPRQLYILMSEITLLKNTIQPIASLVNALREHRSGKISHSTNGVNGAPRHTIASSVEFSPLAYTYLGDVEDHCVSLTAHLDQLAASADQLTGLIFNTMGAYQNESMKQLTLVTILFLPLTFLTGYFGQNFMSMKSIEGSDAFFWYIAVPVEVVVAIYLMRNMISRLMRRLEVKMYFRRREVRAKKSSSSGRGGPRGDRRRGLT